MASPINLWFVEVSSLNVLAVPSKIYSNNNHSNNNYSNNNLSGVLKTGLPEILSQVQHIAGNLSKLNLLKALILLV